MSTPATLKQKELAREKYEKKSRVEVGLHLTICYNRLSIFII